MIEREWHMRDGTQITGPFNRETMLGFIRSGVINARTEIAVRSPYGPWIEAGETDLYRSTMLPPTTSPAAPSTLPTTALPTMDRIAWTLACLPVIGALVQAQAFHFGIPPFYLDWYLKYDLFFYIVLNTVLASTDANINKFRSNLGLLAALMVPFYFIARKRAAGSSYSMLIVNVACFAVSMAITFGKIPILGGENVPSCFDADLKSGVVGLIDSMPAMKMASMKVDKIRSVHETAYDGTSRVCGAEIITSTNVKYSIEYSSELAEKNGETYMRVHFVQ